MVIATGQNVDPDDFVATSAGAGDSGKVAKLDAAGKIGPTFFVPPTEHTSFPVSVTTKANQTIVVIAKGRTSQGASGTYDLTYDGVVKDSYSFSSATDRGEFTLMFVLTPGATTKDVGFNPDSDGKIIILYF